MAGVPFATNVVVDDSVSEWTDCPSHSLPGVTVAVGVWTAVAWAAPVAEDMLPPGGGPLTGGLKEDSKFCAELFLRIAGRGMSDIANGGVAKEIAAEKFPAI